MNILWKLFEMWNWLIFYSEIDFRTESGLIKSCLLGKQQTSQSSVDESNESSNRVNRVLMNRMFLQSRHVECICLDMFRPSLAYFLKKWIFCSSIALEKLEKLEKHSFSSPPETLPKLWEAKTSDPPPKKTGFFFGGGYECRLFSSILIKSPNNKKLKCSPSKM